MMNKKIKHKYDKKLIDAALKQSKIDQNNRASLNGAARILGIPVDPLRKWIHKNGKLQIRTDIGIDWNKREYRDATNIKYNYNHREIERAIKESKRQNSGNARIRGAARILEIPEHRLLQYISARGTINIDIDVRVIWYTND